MFGIDAFSKYFTKVSIIIMYQLSYETKTLSHIFLSFGVSIVSESRGFESDYLVLIFCAHRAKSAKVANITGAEQTLSQTKILKPPRDGI